MKPLRVLLGSVIGVLALFVSCGGGRGLDGSLVLSYGIARPPGDPSVELIDFTYTPANPITPDSILVFQVTTNKPVPFEFYGSFLNIWIGDAARPVPGVAGGQLQIPLSDQGGSADEFAHDLVYTGALVWCTEYGLAENLPVIAKLDWWDETPDVIITGASLKVIAGGAQ